MKVLITGAAGFLGSLLGRTILSQGSLGGRGLERVVLLDRVPAPPDLMRDARVEGRVGELLEQCDRIRAEPFDAVFHLASAVSAECEANFELGLRSNLESTLALLEALRGAGNSPRLVFASSAAVFGSDRALPLPPVVRDETLPTPQTSYGVQKFACEQLVADYTRKGFIDGRAVRLLTVTVRPGRPNGAASGFLSGIVREPLAGVATLCPVALDTEVAIASPQRTIAALLAVHACSAEAFGGRTALNLPALTVSVREMLAALSVVIGPQARDLVRLERDPDIERIVAGWPARFDSARAGRLGLSADPDFVGIIRKYAEEHPAAVKVELRDGSSIEPR